MTNTQRLTIRASEIRERLNAIAGLDGDALTEEARAEETKLQTEYRDAEVKLRASIASDPDPVETRHADTAEGRELRSLAVRADAGEIYVAALESRATTGATHELQEHFNLGPNTIPLAMLETRAVTPAPGTVGATQQPTVPYVFPDAVAAFMGIPTPTVGVGEAVFPVLTKKLDVHTPAENAGAAETTGSFSAEMLTPARIQAAFFYSREDRARFAGMDEALRMNLSDGLADGLDRQILVGTEGLFTGTNLPNNAAAAVTTFAQYKASLAYARVDGRYASGVGDLRVVMGSGTYTHAATAYRGTGNAASDQDSSLDVLMRVTAGVMVSAHVPVVASDKQNAVVRLGMRRDMVAPIWEGISLIPDEITMAKQGQIVITAVMLHAVKILRKAGFHKAETQHA